jgi:hypothetical protein
MESLSCSSRKPRFLEFPGTLDQIRNGPKFKVGVGRRPIGPGVPGTGREPVIGRRPTSESAWINRTFRASLQAW